ncbi:AAA family ATPase [Patescibacteria group bacterium]|nr:AAA family ATPase [Patescibacteria group bacterium]
MFSHIIGHKNITSFLEKSLKNGEISHAYLFYGPARLGKKTVASHFAEAVLGQPILNHPDVYEVRRERKEKEEKLTKNISIEQVREFQQKLSLTSFLNSYKIGIIEEAETLSTEAANSLLKTLEEPTPKTVIILLSTSVSALPATIVSRCQTLKFLPVAKEKIYDRLVELGASRDEARDLAGISWGKPGLAFDFWQTKKEGGDSAVAEYEELAQNILDLMRAETMSERMKIFDEVLGKDSGTEDMFGSVNKILALWTSVLRDAIMLGAGCPELVANTKFSEEIKRISGKFDAEKFPRLYRDIRQAGKYFRENLNPRLVLENLMLSF